MTGAALVKTEDRYIDEVIDGLDCRIRMFTPTEPQETVIVLLSWIAQTCHDVLEPDFSSTVAGIRESVLHMTINRTGQNFSLVEHHLLSGAERVGLILFGETLDSPNRWQSVDREVLEELLGESLEAPIRHALSTV